MYSLRVMALNCLHVCPRFKGEESNSFIEMEITQLEKLGLNVERFFFNGEGKPLNFINGAFKLKSYLKKKEFDIVHIHFGQVAILAILLCGNFKVVTTVHGSELLGIVSEKGNYKKWLTRVIRLQTRIGLRMPAIKGVVFVSEKLRALSFLNSAKKQEVISCGADPEIFRPREREQARKKLGLPLNKKIIFFPANLKRKVKNFNFLEKVLKKLSRGEEYHLLVPENYTLDQMASSYNAADCIVVCSIHEGSPTVIKESLLSNTVVISSDVGDVEYLSKTLGNIHIANSEDHFIHLLNAVLDGKIKWEPKLRFDSIRADETAKKLNEFYLKLLND